MNGALTLDRNTADRLLQGRIGPDDAPPGFTGVARLILALSAPPTESELAGEARAVAVAQALVLMPRPPLAETRPSAKWKQRAGRPRLVKTKIASVIVAGTLFATTGLAVAGDLPASIQNAASTVLSKIGLSVPRASTESRPASTGEEISDIATTTNSTGVDKGAEISSTASGGTSQAGQHGKPSGTHGRQTAPGQQTPPGQQTADPSTETNGHKSGGSGNSG